MAVGESTRGEMRKSELHPMVVPAVLRVPWGSSGFPVPLFCYSISLLPLPPDRDYRPFALFLRSPLPAEAESLQVDLHLMKRRIVRASIVPSGTVSFDADEISAAERFQEMWLKLLLDRTELYSDHLRLGDTPREGSTFYLLLPVVSGEVDWRMVRRCLSSPMFHGQPMDSPPSVALELSNGPVGVEDLLGSLVFNRRNKAFFFVEGLCCDKKVLNARRSNPEQPLLYVKRLFCLRNLLLNTLRDTSGKTQVRCKEEHFQLLPPEFCTLKIIGFAKDVGSTLSLLPSLMHHLQNLLVAVELKTNLSASFPEASAVTATHLLEALTTEQCLECFSLERLEFLGDAFLKFVVARHEFLSNESMDEGNLTDRRRSRINNLNLYELAIERNLQVFIHDEEFIVSQFFALGRPCELICSEENESSIHAQIGSDNAGGCDFKCSKSHRWLHRDTIADVVEALVGAFLFDGGFTAAIAFLEWLGIRVVFKSSDAFRIMQNSKKNLSLINGIDVYRLEQVLSYTFRNKGLLLEAFIHPSYNSHSGGSYQRLEFLGDATFDYLITSYIYSLYPDLGPGELSILRSISVSNGAFAQVAIEHGLHEYIIKNSISLGNAIGRFEKFSRLPDSEKDFLEEPPCPKVLADIVESCFGAILLDSGFDLNCIWEIFLTLMAPILSFDRMQVSPIRELQELCPGCKFKKHPVEGGSYMVEVEVAISEAPLIFSVTNPNSNIAARMASQKALQKLKDIGHKSKRKTIGETLSSTRKEEAKLIGFDERPIKIEDHMSCQRVQQCSVVSCTDQTPPEASLQLLNSGTSSIKLEEPCRDLNFPLNLYPNHSENGIKTEAMIATSDTKGLDFLRNTKGLDDPTVEIHIDYNGTYGAIKGSAKLQLFQMCAVNNLCPPSFLCSREEEMVRCKVTVQIESMADTTLLECFSDPKPNEEYAEEEAAEGAIWYLKQDGHFCP